jgi:hypothetical protein
MKQTSILFCALVVILASCKTEVDLNAPYKNTTIIFGLLDRDSNGDNIPNHLDTQWIKINKTFLGEGDNNVYAGIRDSSEYKEEDFVRKVVEQIRNGEVVGEFDLISATRSDRDMDGGLFYGPAYTAYYFLPPTAGLDQNSEYRIVLEFTDGRVVSATTKLTASGGGGDAAPTLSALNFAEPSNNGFNYKDVSLLVDTTNASIYEVSLRFHFIEKVYASSDWSLNPISETPKYIDFFVGTINREDPQLQGKHKIIFNGRSFFTFLQNNLVADLRIRREIGIFDSQDGRTECFDRLVTMGNSDLKSYIDVNSPSTGIVQERPIYSNVSNGIGLFASRGSKNLFAMPLVSQNGSQPNVGTLTALVESEYTAALNFCDPNGASDFYCND